ncbi:hypothetical protein [Croceicoccus sp. BE223]|uniref:hypothetical protein n=1 Tax=Croceicoccus sp. BE223 TaxID=2817716 RepID=UPI0028566994|nr:hypothetical protein [Croceicoccus sp. BE223]MDR7102977.1 hypothetical protein [Croceicoccus sp. BE223]
MRDDDVVLVVKYSTEQPLELAALTSSLGALSDEYRRRYGDTGAVLVVDHIREGSVVAILKGMAKAAVSAVDPTGGALVAFTLDTIAPFAGDFSGLLNALANFGRDAASDADIRRADKSSLRAAKAFVQPALNGNPIQLYGDVDQIVQNNVYIDSMKAGDIVRNVTHLMAAMPGDDERFKAEPLALYQLRDARAGDLGYIDRFDKRPKRLIFANDSVKDEIIHGERPFDMFFFVSGVVRTAGGEVASYYIESIDGVTEKDAA